MKKWKNMVASLCIMAVMVVCAAPVVHAANGGISLFMEHIAEGSCSLYVSSTTGRVNAYVQGRTDVTKTEVEVELQERHFLFFWTTVETWSSTSNSDYCRASGSVDVTSGNTYRAVATLTAWVGSSSETQTITTESRVAE